MTMTDIWNAGRRRYVTECLERDEFPYHGWDKDYPDLAEQRRKKLVVEQPSPSTVEQEDNQ